MPLANWTVLLMAIGGMALLILGRQRVGIALLMPAFLRWILLPVLWPELRQIPFALILVGTLLVLVFGSLLVLDRIVSFVYGPRAGAHVTAIYLVRVLDAIGRGTIGALSLLFRFAMRFFGA